MSAVGALKPNNQSVPRPSVGGDRRQYIVAHALLGELVAFGVVRIADYQSGTLFSLISPSFLSANPVYIYSTSHFA